MIEGKLASGQKYQTALISQTFHRTPKNNNWKNPKLLNIIIIIINIFFICLHITPTPVTCPTYIKKRSRAIQNYKMYHRISTTATRTPTFLAPDRSLANNMRARCIYTTNWYYNTSWIDNYFNYFIEPVGKIFVLQCLP